MKTFSALSCASAAVFTLLLGCSSPTTSPMAVAPMRAAAAPAKYGGLDDLYVADYDTGKVFLFKDDGYTPDGSITTGISGPWDVTLDRSGNLYVANAAGGNITEYAPGTSTPSFTYFFAMISPRLVTVDRQGNLFETDFTGYDEPGRVSEYRQASNHPLYSCTVPGPWGVAVDSSGDVFVDYNGPRGAGGHIEEFKGGLARCNSTALGAHVDNATGIVLDRRNDLVVGDANAKRIDVIPPPYTAIARHLNTGGRAPLFISIDKANSKVFASVSGFYHSYVIIVGYPGGRFEQRLGYSRGKFGSPYGVVDAPNEIP
ncbi:MAG: hypothetical protein WB609_07705 [Candidatus Cybelea sp.]